MRLSPISDQEDLYQPKLHIMDEHGAHPYRTGNQGTTTLASKRDGL